jgi:beta-glucosidase/6-phospho-beta-glucosidase/beta-galactosidase
MHSDLNVLKADLDRAKALGCNAYRMSIEWSRVEPAATGGFNSLLHSHTMTERLIYWFNVV